MLFSSSGPINTPFAHNGRKYDCGIGSTKTPTQANTPLRVPVSLPIRGSHVIACSNLASPKRTTAPSRHVCSLQSGPSKPWLVCNIMAGSRPVADEDRRKAGRQPERKSHTRLQDRSPHRPSQAAWCATDLAVGCP